MQNSKYFLIDTQRSPGWYLFMRNDDEGRIMSWNHNCAVDDIHDPQSLWIIRPRAHENNSYVFELSTKKWPDYHIYVHDIGFEWIHATTNPSKKGLFHLRANMPEEEMMKSRMLNPIAEEKFTNNSNAEQIFVPDVITFKI